MTPRIELLNDLAAQGAAVTLAVLWQSTLVALLVWALTRALWRSSPAVRYWLWQLVAIKLLVMPFWTWSLPEIWPGETIAAAPADITKQDTAAGAASDSPPTPATKAGAPVVIVDRAVVAVAQPAAPSLTWQAWLLVAWAALVVLQVGQLIVQRLRLRRLLRGTRPAGEALIATVREVAERIGLARMPAVRLAPSDCSPFVYGIFRSALVLPHDLVVGLSGPELQQVVAHELAHLRRRDLLWGWIPRIARVLYFFHPVAYWAESQVRLERELACDQVAMSVGDRRPAEYAETLVRVMGLTSQSGAMRACAAGGVDENGL